MERDKISDDVRYVVNNRHTGSIFPTKLIELNRAVFLQDGAVVDGAIYGHSLYVTGGTVTVSRSIFANHSLKISMEADGKIDFKSSLNSSKSLFVERHQADNYVRVRGDIYVENANLNGVIVYGNVHGHNINITDSAVLGGVFSDGKVITRESVVGLVMSKQIHLNDGTKLWLPYCIGEERLELSGRVRGFTLGLPESFSQLLDHKLTDVLENETPLSQEDVYTIPAVVHKEKQNEDTPMVKILTLQPRLNDLYSVKASMKANLRVHDLVLNTPGIPERDKGAAYDRFDRAIREYLNI